MGLTYDELGTFGILRKVELLGPWSAYLRLLNLWQDRPGFGPREIAEKTKRFYRFWALNRHKAVVLTPSIHLSAYNTDDNRFDLRPFLLVVSWPYQFAKIDRHVEELIGRLAERGNTADPESVETSDDDVEYD